MRFGFLKKLFSSETLPARLGYEDARAVLESQSLAAKRELAARSDAPPETLYFLSNDEDAKVRALVAANPSTPIQANEGLSLDLEGDVRAELARKIGRIVPDMKYTEINITSDRVMALLERLAKDEVTRVRQIVAEEIKSCPNVPKRLAVALARDAELIVCAPVLEYSPLLSDEDLVEIIATSRVQGALEAIARRRSVDGSLADAIVATLEIPAIAQLLANPNAEIREDTLDRIISEAASIEAWHLPLVMRPALSLRAIRRISIFVSRALIDELARHASLDEETLIHLKSRAQSRIESNADDVAPTPGKTLLNIKRAFDEGKLGDDLVSQAASLQQKAAVVQALCLKTGIDQSIVTRIIEAKSGKGIAALCWKAGLSMRTALSVEIFIANVAPDARVLPRGGIDYPMDEKEMLWHLNYFGVEAKV
tara:strand:+ start:16815 stop:18089 length:1275 start_codon:yes stop_codon:yes gene_type:complete